MVADAGLPLRIDDANCEDFERASPRSNPGPAPRGAFSGQSERPASPTSTTAWQALSPEDLEVNVKPSRSVRGRAATRWPEKRREGGEGGSCKPRHRLCCEQRRNSEQGQHRANAVRPSIDRVREAIREPSRWVPSLRMIPSASAMPRGFGPSQRASRGDAWGLDGSAWSREDDAERQVRGSLHTDRGLCLARRDLPRKRSSLGCHRGALIRRSPGRP
jgi:hypothetical protein